MRFTEQWSWCTVESVRDVTPTIREFRLRPKNGHVAPYPAGSHIGVTVLIDGQPARRCYSLVENSDAGTYRIAVRLARDGGLTVFRHPGYWASMDTQRDMEQLTELYVSGKAPWTSS